MQDLSPQRFELEPIEVAPVEVIRDLQLHRLKWSLRHAYENVPHYRQVFDAKGIKPEDLRTLDDLQRYPFTGKAELRANYPFGMFAVPQNQIARIHASSGTTGKPTVVGYTKRDLATWRHVVGRCLRASGGRPGMKLHNAYGYGLFTGGLGYHDGAEDFGLAVVPVSGGMTERQVQLIEDFRPDLITVTPSYMLAILDEFRRQGKDPRKTSLKVGIFGAEPWTNAMREEIEQAFGIHAVDTYGLSEVMGPGVANECVESKDGPTIWEDHFYPEIVDPVTGELKAEGELGELVFTSLTKEAMPVIRYRTRDITRLLPGTARTMRSDRAHHRPVGRHDDRARRQCFSKPNRGADPQSEIPGAALSIGADPRGQNGRIGSVGGGCSSGIVDGGEIGFGWRAQSSHQEQRWCDRKDQGRRSWRRRTQPRESGTGR